MSIESTYEDTPRENSKNTQKVKVLEISSGKIITMWAIDAKEAIASGRYEEYARNKDQTTGTPRNFKKTDAVSNNAELGDDEENEEEDDSEDFNPNEVKKYNTDQLEKYVSDNEIEIDDFDKLNLKDKRTALYEHLTAE